MGSGRGIVLNCKLIVLVVSYQRLTLWSECISMAVPENPLGKKQDKGTALHRALIVAGGLSPKSLLQFVLVLKH